MSSTMITEDSDDIETLHQREKYSRRHMNNEGEKSEKMELVAMTTGASIPSEGNAQSAFSVAHCQEMGRYVVAAKDLTKGEIIFQEAPLTSGPERDSVLICPGCYQAPAENSPCGKCEWPLCGSNCPGIGRHEMECSFLSEVTRKGEERDWRLLSDCLMVIRCLLLKYHDVPRWQSLLDMETNWDFWSRSPLYARAEETIRVLRTEFGMTEDKFTSDEMLDVQAVLDINAYEVRMPYVNIQASYSLARLAEHNCVPNTHKTISTLPADYIDSFISSAEEQLQELDKEERDEKTAGYEVN
ncbi:unnamed protein product [Allacma fusca]|uniref:SET domain-containing protein n=1 Tax=Allacma fusca TaxID=39272 RepID=A0A8J2KK03_9HEXA|nr:unnamed protein product [Allacma fusca]